MTVSGAGGLYLNELCGLIVLSYCLQRSMSTCASLSVEDFSAQKLVAELSFKRLIVSVLPGAAWFDKSSRRTCRDRF